MSTHNSSILSSAYALGVNPDLLALWLDEVSPKPGAKPKNAISDIGNQMAVIIEKQDPELAQQWRMANYFHHKHTRQ